ncbi:O-fucosyltransferase 23-like [Olea europaea var. sylvestris]|uniref:O-fucosyltransferase 23-like n=1 Tax=Olea europaea var. sylvestris TaxID=158386 RepID=UPI000C1CF092|nr:O-fucosyltransferase 23-like [Olea europaea var. sylvestris]
MDLSKYKNLRFFVPNLNSLACKCVALTVIALVLRAVFLPRFCSFRGIEPNNSFAFNKPFRIYSEFHSRNSKFLEVPQIVWGLNNQKIALARACLTARLLNRTLLMPSLSASLFYKEIDKLEPISFHKVFQFEKFNSLCKGFVQLARHSEISNRSNVFELQKGTGRRWTIEKDLDQLRQLSSNHYDDYEVIRITGKNPFLWHDHWPVEDYSTVFQCLVLVEDISRQADKVISKIRQIGLQENHNISTGYVAVHMRIEKDWMIHCKKMQQRSNISEICSSKDEIMERVTNIVGLKKPVAIYIAVADNLLEDKTLLSGWNEGLLPFTKKKLGVVELYEKQPYLIQSAIDYEVCLRSNVFVGNSFSTFSSLVVLDRTQKMINIGVGKLCGIDVMWPSYAYNLLGKSKGPRPWATNMSDSSLNAVSYGTNHISCL